ncbi:MAG: DUF1049 domain-containing protein [Desulfobacterales bacterium]|nr:DUF1049 domain-containing protein [Desulfobacterales bacterium]
MRTLKHVLWLLATGFVVVVVLQNFDVLTHKEALRLNLPLIEEYQTEPVQLFLYFLGFFFIGLLLSYFHGLGERFKARSLIKKHLKTISNLEEKVETLKNLPVHHENTPSRETEIPEPD